MPDMQPIPTGAAMPQGIERPILLDDPDVALGCECADPALQIERWAQEALDRDGH